MPSYRVKITGLAPHRDTPALVKMLVRIPGLTPERVVQGLQRPPLELPPVAHQEQAHQISDSLLRLGAISIVEEIHAAPVKVVSRDDELVDGSHLLHSAPPARPSYSRHQDSEHVPAAQPSTPPARKDRKALIIFGIALAMAAALLYQNDPMDIGPRKNPAPSKETASKASTAKSTTAKAERAASTQKSTREGLSGKHEAARKQQAYSEQLRERSRQTTDPAKAAQILKQSVQYNPYNAEAWKELEEKLRESGQTEEAEAARKAHAQAKRVTNTLQSIAKAFGGNPNVKVSTSSISYKASVPMEDQEFYEAVNDLYDSVSVSHFEKELLVENQYGSRSQRMRIVPGEPFPSQVEH